MRNAIHTLLTYHTGEQAAAGRGQGGWPIRILTPNRVRKLLLVWRGGGGGWWIGRSAAGVPGGGGGGSVGTPTHMLQNRLPIIHHPTCRSGRVKMLFCVFHPFLISPQNSQWFEYRHTG